MATARIEARLSPQGLPRAEIRDLGLGAYDVIRIALARLVRDAEEPGYRDIAEELVGQLPESELLR